MPGRWLGRGSDHTGSAQSLEMVRRHSHRRHALPFRAVRSDAIEIRQGQRPTRGETVTCLCRRTASPLACQLISSRNSLTPLFITGMSSGPSRKRCSSPPRSPVEGKEPELRTVVAYVTNEELGYGFRLDRTKGPSRLHDSGGASSRASWRHRISRAFVLNGGGDSITVIDPSNQSALHTFNIEVHAQAREMALLTRGRPCMWPTRL